MELQNICIPQKLTAILNQSLIKARDTPLACIL